ncbi:MAG: hypothetical protein J1E16_11615 [Muribaculaceae bacterium]|nr:hypothetical protein [Muribaculaceae bacterium]
MSIDDNENIYNLEEPEENENSPLNYAAYPDEEEGEELEGQQEGQRKSAISLLIKVMFNPVEGWKTLRRSGITPESLQGGCFYPILALLAVSKFAEFFYYVNVSLAEVLTQAVISFVAFFLGYFCIMMLISWVIPKEMKEKYNDKFAKNFTIISLSTLALFSIITNFLPMIWPILIFLPLWTLYLMYKGIRFFHFPVDKEMKLYVIISAGMIGLPYMLDWLMNELV